MNNEFDHHISLASLVDSANECCVRYAVTSFQEIANYLIANAEFTGWDISPECLNDYITAIQRNAAFMKDTKG